MSLLLRVLHVCTTLVKTALKPSLFQRDYATSTFHYLKPLDLYRTVKPYHINVPAAALAPGLQSNEESQEYRNLRVIDVRGRESEFTLEVNGFQYFNERNLPLSLSGCVPYNQYQDADLVKSVYRRMTERFVKATLGANFAHAFAHEVRRRDDAFPSLPRGRGYAAQPVQGVHVDVTPKWARGLLDEQLPSNLVSQILKRRWQILNVWRPLRGPVLDWPLAVCDYQSLEPTRDLVASDNIYTHKITETYNVLWNPRHRWHYLSEMQPHEILILKSFDSKVSKHTAQVCPHAAIEYPVALSQARPKAKPRESIECLLVVAYPGDVATDNDQRKAKWSPQTG